MAQVQQISFSNAPHSYTSHALAKRNVLCPTQFKFSKFEFEQSSQDGLFQSLGAAAAKALSPSVGDVLNLASITAQADKSNGAS